MYVDDRDSLQDWLLRRGIHARVYWDEAELPKGALDAFPGLRRIVDRILVLPTHQGLQPKHWVAMSSAVRSFFASSSEDPLKPVDDEASNLESPFVRAVSGKLPTSETRCSFPTGYPASRMEVCG